MFVVVASSGQGFVGDNEVNLLWYGTKESMISLNKDQASLVRIV
jgi:hypothetical protein